MITTQITDAANAFKGFSELPITTQITVLFPLIQAARNLNIPHKMIVAAMAEAGSTISYTYYREAYSIVSRRLGTNVSSPQVTGANLTSPSVPTGTAQTVELEAVEDMTPKERREAMAAAFIKPTEQTPLFGSTKKA